MPKARVNDCLIHYRQAGRGRDLVFIHGLFGNMALWYFSILPPLTSHFRLCLYDMRGHGRSEIRERGYTSSNMADDLRGLLRHLGIAQAHLAGYSFGGAVALHCATHYPETVLSLTLVDAWIPCFQQPFPRRNAFLAELRDLDPRRWEDQDVRKRRMLARGAIEQALLDAAQQGAVDVPIRLRPHPDIARVKQWARLTKATSMGTEIFDTGDLTAGAVKRVTQPVQAIYGQYSHCLPSLAGLQESLPQCVSAIVPRLGHFHPFLKPQVLLDNLKQLAIGGPS